MILPKNDQSDEEAMNGFFNQLLNSIKPESGNLNQMTLTLHMQLILKAITTAIMGSAIAYFASLQTIFLVLSTDDILGLEDYRRHYLALDNYILSNVGNGYFLLLKKEVLHRKG